MFDFTSYLFFPDYTGVILLNRWFDVSQWYFIYPIAILHTIAWVSLKVGFFRWCVYIVQSLVARRKQKVTIVTAPVTAHSTVWYRRLTRVVWCAIVFAARAFWRFVVYVAHQSYAGAKRIAHGKAVNGYSLFWLALTPLLQKVSDAIVGIRWKQFGWRGIRAICYGASVQTACFCMLYTLYGEERKAEAEQIMLWTMIPLGAIMLLSWLLKNGRSKSA